MRRLTAHRFLALVLVASTLAGCRPSPVTPEAVVPVLSPAVTAATTATLVATTSVTATLNPTATSTTRTSSSTPTQTMPSEPTALATGIPTPSATPSPPPTLVPPQPPLLVPAPGKPLEFSLGWRFGSYAHLADAAIIYENETQNLVVASLDGNTYALAEDGEILWKASTEGPAYALAVLDGARVVVGDDAGGITLLNGQGRRLWQHDLGSRVTALDAGRQGDLLAGGWQEGPPHGGQMTLLSSEGDEDHVRWQIDLDSPVSDVAFIPDISHPSLPEGVLSVGATLDGEIRALDSSGLERWRFDAGAPVVGLGPLNVAGAPRILVGTQDGRLLALDAGMERAQEGRAGTRLLLWQQSLGEGGPVWSTADLVGGPAPEIITGMGGRVPLLALLSSDGDMLWRIATDSPVNAVVSADMDRDGNLEILAGLASGEIQAYDVQGQLLGKIHAGLPVWDLAAAPDSGAFALADVVAWQILDRAGPTGGPWLPPPALASSEDTFALPGGDHFTGEDGTSTATLVFLGDVAPGRSMEAQLLRYGPDAPWAGISAVLKAADLSVANLESVLSTQGQPRDKPYLIRAHPYWGQALAAGGLGLVSLSNNHALDYGQVGLDGTLAALEALGVAAVGASSSAEDAQPNRPALYELNGLRVALLGYAAARWNGSEDMPATDRVAWAEPEAISADVAAARGQADLVIVLLHAGAEYAKTPSPAQEAAAKAAIDAGAGLVVGHHPHVTQTVERYKDGLIVYSLGDALFDIPRPEAMRGDLLHVEISKDGLDRAELWPFWIEDAFHPRFLDNGEGTPQVQIIYP